MITIVRRRRRSEGRFGRAVSLQPKQPRKKPIPNTVSGCSAGVRIRCRLLVRRRRLSICRDSRHKAEVAWSGRVLRPIRAGRIVGQRPHRTVGPRSCGPAKYPKFQEESSLRCGALDVIMKSICSLTTRLSILSVALAVPAVIREFIH